MSEEKMIYQSGLVSVVTPVYNNEAYLSEMLDSILSQTYDDIQMILVDDGSVDGTREIAESYREKFSKRGFEYTVVYQEHRNTSSAINGGLPLVKGEYIIWPDSDDILKSESVEKRVSFLKEHSEYNAVRSLPEYFDASTGESAPARENISPTQSDYLFWDVLEVRSFVSCGCYMLKSKELFAIYPERKIPVYDVGQNFQMLLPYLYRHECATIPEPLYRVRVHDGSHSVRKRNLRMEIEVIRGFERLVDEIAKLCPVTDKAELKRIKDWKQGRRNALRRRTIRKIPAVKFAIRLWHKLR